MSDWENLIFSKLVVPNIVVILLAPVIGYLFLISKVLIFTVLVEVVLRFFLARSIALTERSVSETSYLIFVFCVEHNVSYMGERN